MKRPFLLFLPFLLFIAGAFVACEEVEEAGKYDNWVPRNEAFIDSIKGKTGDNIVASLEDAEKMEIGTLYAISVPTSGTGVNGTLCPARNNFGYHKFGRGIKRRRPFGFGRVFGQGI